MVAPAEARNEAPAPSLQALQQFQKRLAIPSESDNWNDRIGSAGGGSGITWTAATSNYVPATAYNAASLTTTR